LQGQVSAGDVDRHSFAIATGANIDARLPVRHGILAFAVRVQATEIEQRSRNGVCTDNAESCSHEQSLNVDTAPETA
jgi:hypothetical protein